MEPLVKVEPHPVYLVPTVTHQADIGEVYYIPSRLCAFDSISLVWSESMANGLAGGQLCCHGNYIPGTIK